MKFLLSCGTNASQILAATIRNVGAYLARPRGTMGAIVLLMIVFAVYPVEHGEWELFEWFVLYFSSFFFFVKLVKAFLCE